MTTATQFETAYEEYIDALAAKDAAYATRHEPRCRQQWKAACKRVREEAVKCQEIDPEGDYPEARYV